MNTDFETWANNTKSWASRRRIDEAIATLNLKGNPFDTPQESADSYAFEVLQSLSFDHYLWKELLNKENLMTILCLSSFE